MFLTYFCQLLLLLSIRSVSLYKILSREPAYSSARILLAENLLYFILIVLGAFSINAFVSLQRGSHISSSDPSALLFPFMSIRKFPQTPTTGCYV